MSRVIKFEFMWKNESSIAKGKYTIDDIVNGCAKPPRSRDGSIMRCWELIARRQYTGLKDKNGVEIYEGDITPYLECSRQGKVNAHIYYCAIKSQFRVKWIDDGIELSDSLGHCNEWFDVIGNIHQNPELIK